MATNGDALAMTFAHYDNRAIDRACAAIAEIEREFSPVVLDVECDFRRIGLSCHTSVDNGQFHEIPVFVVIDCGEGGRIELRFKGADSKGPPTHFAEVQRGGELTMGGSKARRRGGRPCRLTVAVALELVHLVSQGETLEDAARLAGLGPTTLWRWLTAGRAGDPRFSALVEAIDRAQRSSGLARLVRRNEQDLGRLLSQN